MNEPEEPLIVCRPENPAGPGGHSGPAAKRHPGLSPEDQALVKRLLAGDEESSATLVERYHGRLLQLARLFVSDTAIAEEVVQETWLGVLGGLRAFGGRCALKTWMFRILTNRAKSRATRECRTVSFSALPNPESTREAAVDPARFTPGGKWSVPPRSWSEETPEGLLMQAEAVAFLKRRIAELPPNQRAVVTLRDIEELGSDEICHNLNISEVNQRVLLHRARARLRNAFEQYFGKELSAHAVVQGDHGARH